MVFDSNLRPTAAESECIASLRKAIKSLDVPTPASGPTLDHETILLRFVRGYSLSVKDATKAFSEMLAYRSANNIAAAREAMYAAKSLDDKELAWPASMPKFEPLVTLTGGGLMQRIGHSANGCPVTLCLIHLYDVKAVIREGLASLLVELQQWQDEWWGIHLLRESEAAGSMLAREDVVHVAEVGLFYFDISTSKFCMRVLEGSKHYPENSARIVSTGNSRVLLAVYHAVVKPFLPAHTKQKLLALGKDIEKQTNKEAIGFDEATFATLLSMCGRTAIVDAAIVDVSDQ